MPTTTSDKISMVAKTGRRTQSWASVCMGYRACGCTCTAAPSKRAVCPPAGTVSLPLSPLTMRILAPPPPDRGWCWHGFRSWGLSLYGGPVEEGVLPTGGNGLIAAEPVDNADLVARHF